MQGLELAAGRRRTTTTTTTTTVRWFSAKAVGCHVTVLVLVPAFLTAAWWQLQRAEAGNVLSYLYCVEWPMFAGVAVWVWWQVIHLPPPSEADPGPAATGWLRWDPADESPALREYNRRLAELAALAEPAELSPPRRRPGRRELPARSSG